MNDLQAKSTNSLALCPFCGGEAFVRIDVSLRQTQSRYRVGCDRHPSCHGWYGHSRYYTTEAEAIAAWNTRAATTIGKVQVEIEPVSRGILTAERVSKATYAHSIHADCADADWQAIADELNAELESGTCELVYGENDYGDDGWWCQSCGEWFAASFRHTGRNNIIKPSYCQHCGKSVKR